MITLSEIERLKELIQQLKAKDKQLLVFGAETHKYELGPTLNEEEIQAFERKHQIALPEDYRLFVKVVGNGGAGPEYGLLELEAAAEDTTPNKPFPLTKSSEEYSDDEQEALMEDLEEEHNPGLLQISDAGDAIYYYLVVKGPAYGTIWNIREDYYPASPNFLSWYRQWVEVELGR